MTAGPNFLVIGLILVPLAVLWIAALYHIVARRRDLSIGWKGLWTAVVVALPFVGVIAYSLMRPPRPPQRTNPDDPTSIDRAIDRLQELVEAHQAGTIGDEAYTREKLAVFDLADTAG